MSIHVEGELIAEVTETWRHPSGSFRLLPYVEGMEQRVRVEPEFEIGVVPGFKPKAKGKRKRGRGERTAFLGRVEWTDHEAA